MASAKKKQRKNGSFFYEISVSRGYSKSPYTMRWDVPEGLAAKTVKARLQDLLYGSCMKMSLINIFQSA